MMLKIKDLKLTEDEKRVAIRGRSVRVAQVLKVLKVLHDKGPVSAETLDELIYEAVVILDS